MPEPFAAAAQMSTTVPGATRWSAPADVGMTTDAVVRASAEESDDRGISSPAPTKRVTTSPSAESGET